MSYGFYAYMSRMKLIDRWSLMRNTRAENIAEHSQQVAMLAHALALIGNRYFGESNDAGQIVLLALYHDVGEVVIGDLPTPVKYYNPAIKRAYGELEQAAKRKLLEKLPEPLREDYLPYLFAGNEAPLRIVKAADKLAAYIKCIEEATAGNCEFTRAQASIKKELDKFTDVPALKWFLQNCIESFAMTIDELE
ncbi:MAG: 5'-deoxynucleotidase [Bacillota bacterium]|nr:5'-deoxynucleotidase [Bacillota bacterium]